ncbi:MAG TPA: carbohydrate ABC transporter permease [Clostridiales bacterium]|nr:carbohydrate ABC transporter permease [Clostridiales bacterium]
MKFKKMSDIIFDVLVYFIAVVAFVITLYPFLYIFSVSLSDLDAINRGEVRFLPVGFDFSGYKEVLTDKNIWVAYGNTIFYVVVGTTCNMFMTIFGAYALSRKTFGMRRFFNFFISFTMYFSGGLIPTYLLITNLGLYNTRLVMILPVMISTYNMMICRSAFSAVPDEMMESASIEGANDIHILTMIYVRLITPTLVVLILYYAVGHWNTFFNAMLYLKDDHLQPLQVLLRRVLIQSSQELLMDSLTVEQEKRALVSIQIRYAAIIVSTLPILMVYPFLQKYFISGIMLGAVKG